MSTKTAKRPNFSLALEEAKDAVTKLRSVKPFLSPADEETLNILIDKELMKTLSKSLVEARQGKCQPLKSVLK